MILFENVPGITTKTVEKGSKTLIVDVLIRELEEAGYVYHKNFILDSTDYGVPQKRKRFFILASKKERYIEEPEKNIFPKVTVEDAFVDLPNVIPNSGEEKKYYLEKDSSYSKLMKDDKFWNRAGFGKELSYHMPMRHRGATIKRFSLL